MNLKYYLRGLGIGVLVTVFIMGIAGEEKTMTDAEIKIRAAKLGMVEETVLSDLKAKESTENEGAQTESLAKTLTESQMVEEKTEEELSKEESDGKENTENTEEKKETAGEAAVTSNGAENTILENDAPLEGQGKVIVQANGIVGEEKDYLTVTIESGDTGEAVSRKLYEAGAVESAAEYSSYLSSNDYSRRLRVGEYEIPVGASNEEIAKIICGIE
ncbi:MAG: endolytic transglycosylase MltG [Lachnospiraceae bacterium]|nr:endolytic transglycosylase MltG [Lachnospiraceae bacterium]MDD7026895.1 hypothetical protein [Lachnospiraceae bacterium]MDY5701691.1 hypothetical protein [Lachnospiraceae bacterium]